MTNKKAGGKEAPTKEEGKMKNTTFTKKLASVSLTVILTAALIGLLIPFTAMTSNAAETVGDQTRTDLTDLYDDSSAFLSMYGDELPADVFAALDCARSQAYPVIGSDSNDAYITAISNLRVQLEVAEAYMEGRPANTTVAPHHIMGTAAGNRNGVNGVSADTANTVATIYATNRNLPANMIRGKIVENFVDRIYMDVLGRHVDNNNALVAGIMNDSIDAEDAAESLLNSPEFINRNVSNTEFVKILYRVFLDREADTAGLNNWVNALNNGTSRAPLIDTFEDLQAWDNLCTFYGIDN